MLEKKDAMSAIANYKMKSTLRGVDLNLLTVFDAVMQEQNITRAAHNLGMSQPTVSNAVARLKVMFNDELFMRQGRGIQPTQRARQLFGPIRQALQLIRKVKNNHMVANTSTIPCQPLRTIILRRSHSTEERSLVICSVTP